MAESIRLVSSGDDIKIWNSSSMTVVDQFNPHATTHPVSRVCWSSNNHFLVSACASGDKIVVSSCKSSPVPVLDLAEGKRQTCVNLNSTSQFIVSGGLDNTVNIWDLKSKKLHRSLKDHKDVVTCVSFNGNDSYIASGSTSGEIILHSITTNLSSTPFGHGSTQPIQDLKYSSVKKSLMGSVSDSGTVVLWDANTQKPQHTFESAHKAPACGLCFSPANELLFVTVGLDKRIICYDTSSKKVLRGMVAESPLTAIDFMPDGAVLAVGSSRGKIYLYDLRMLTSPVKTVSAHKTSVQCLKFQHSPSQTKSSSKTSASKSSTTLSASTYKRATVQSSTREALQKPAAPAAPAAQHTFGAPAAGERGDGRQDNSAEMPRSTSLDVFPSKETDSLKSINHLPSLEKFDNVGRNSLSDVLSPVRDDYTTQKGSGDCSKGDGLDFLSQFTSGLPARRAPLGTPGVQTSPFNMFGDSPQPVREEEEEPKRGRAQLGLQDTKPISKGSSSATEPASMNTTGMLGSFKSPDMRGKDVQTKLQYEFPVNGALPSVPILSPSPGVSAAGVASSLSERIADTIGSDGSSAPLTSIQIHFIRNMIQETLEDFRESCHRDIVNLQVEMIRQFYIQLNEIHSLIERYSVTDVLVAEIEKLKEENKKLRTNF